MLRFWLERLIFFCRYMIGFFVLKVVICVCNLLLFIFVLRMYMFWVFVENNGLKMVLLNWCIVVSVVFLFFVMNVGGIGMFVFDRVIV